MGPDVCLYKVREFLNLNDVTLADQATNSIPTDNANMTIQGNVVMQLEAKFPIWWQIL